MKTLLATLAAVLAFSGSASADECKTTDIEITQLHWTRPTDTHVKFAGEVVNHCAYPTGFQIKLTFRTQAGEVIDSHEIWPHSISNIEAGESYAFSYTTSVDGDFKLDPVKVTGVHHWPPRR